MGTLGALLVGIGSAVMILSVLLTSAKEAVTAILSGVAVAGLGFWLAWLSLEAAPEAQGITIPAAWWGLMISQVLGTFLGGLMLCAVHRRGPRAGSKGHG